MEKIYLARQKFYGLLVFLSTKPRGASSKAWEGDTIPNME